MFIFGLFSLNLYFSHPPLVHEQSSAHNLILYLQKAIRKVSNQNNIPWFYSFHVMRKTFITVFKLNNHMRRKISTRRPVSVKNSPTKILVSTIVPLGIRPLAAQVGVGILCASYWRGMWYILDDNLFPDNSLYSGTASLAMGTSGLAIAQGYMAHYYQKEMQRKNLPRQYTALSRFGSLYCVSVSCVLVWRGAWVLWDEAYEDFNEKKVKATDRHHLTNSGMLSHLAAIVGLLVMGRFSSVLAPPSNISILKDITLKGRTRTWKEYSDKAKWFFK